MKTQEELVRQHAVGPINIYKIYQEGYQDRELDDWGAFRREAAKDLLVAMTRRVIDDPDQLDAFEPDFYARVAVEWADSLVKHLKKEKE